MLWTNKAHQFDEIGKLFKDREIIIYGAGKEGIEFYNKIEFLNTAITFVDRNEELQLSGFRDQMIISVNDLAKMDHSHYIVIVTVQGYNGTLVMNQLFHLGYRLGVDCFSSNIFLDYFLPIYALYNKNIVYFPSISFLVTTKCNLNCYGCLNFTNHNSSKRHYGFEELKQNSDCFFNAVDFVEKFHMSGGEPFLNPDFVQILQYVYETYKNKIGRIFMATNGTIMPNNDTLDALRRCNVFVEVDDYRSALPQFVKKNDDIIAKLQDYEICYSDRGADYWIDLLPADYNDSPRDDSELRIWYNTCNNPFASVHDKKIYSCNYSDYANEAGIVQANQDDYLDLTVKQNKNELVEFRLGYTERGYVEFCKHCAGHEMINRSHIPVARQIRGGN